MNDPSPLRKGTRRRVPSPAFRRILFWCSLLIASAVLAAVLPFAGSKLAWLSIVAANLYMLAMLAAAVRSVMAETARDAG